MKRFLAAALAVIMIAMLTASPVLAAGDPQPVVAAVSDDYVIVDVSWDVDEPWWDDYFTLWIGGRPSTPISRKVVDFQFFAHLEEAAYALSAEAAWDDGIVTFNLGEGRNIATIAFRNVNGFEEDGVVWVDENFVWEVSWLLDWRMGPPPPRDDIAYAVPVVRTTDHGDMATDFIRHMNDNLYNRVPFSYRELEAAEWIRDTLIEMGYDESAVRFQTFTIEDLMDNWFAGSLFMYEQFNAFDPDGRMTAEEAVNIIIETAIEQQYEWLEIWAEQMGITIEEAKAMEAEWMGIFVDMFDIFIEARAREMAPWQLNFPTVFGLFDPDTHFRPMSQNVILTVPGQSERTIVVTAHYCSIMVPGASDNASGTALLLESAYRLLEVENYFTIKYIFMGAEEIGILGAYYYVQSLTRAEQNNIVLNINADVLFEGPYFFFGAGARDFHSWWVGENDVTAVVVEVAEMVNETYGTVLINAPDMAGSLPSDHLAFLDNGHTVVVLVGLARIGCEEYEGFDIWSHYPGFTSSIVHTEYDCYHYINARWPDKIGDAMWTFSLFLDYLLAAGFPYEDLPEIPGPERPTSQIPDDADLTDHPLVGTWQWDDNTEWTFVFNADGTGQRGLPDSMVDFVWYADDFTLFIEMEGSYITEFWQQFSIDDDAITLGLQWWISMSYTRVND